MEENLFEENILVYDKEIGKIDKEIELLKKKRIEIVSKKEKLKNSIQEKRSADLANKDWSRQDFVWSEKLKKKLEDVFKIKTFRAHQLPAMNATMSGTDCILIMPTGGGKSLCYQLPALVSEGITLVVSPLVSLMEDQLMALHKLNVDAKMLCSTATKEEVGSVMKDMIDPKASLKLLYVTPEKLSKSKRFMAKLQKMHQMGRFARLAIDEVHCCSHWGHDFRPDFKFLGIMRKMFPGTPIIGLTATATSKVITDVQKILNVQGCLILRASFNRPNLFYEVRQKPSVKEECLSQLCNLLKREFEGQSGIIYTMTIKDTEELATGLREKGVRVAPYHAHLEPAVRSKIHRKWVENDYQAVVATIAFGMGIDKPDVRFVIHHCISKSMENFYQESGRAGRDDKPSKCIVYWRFADLFRQSTMVFTENTGLENIYGLISYCVDSHRCRRNLIAHHFDEVWESGDCNRMCDHCVKDRTTAEVDLSKYGDNLLKILKKSSNKDSRLTGTKLVDIWMGKGASNLRVEEATIKGIDREKAESIIAHLLIDGFLQEDFHFTPYSTISYIIPGPKAEAGLTPSPMTVTRPAKNGASEDQASRKRDRDEKTSTKPKKSKVENCDVEIIE